jgi:hypothetical protein
MSNDSGSMPSLDMNKTSFPSSVDNNFAQASGSAVDSSQPNLVGFYRVSLACEAAPQIGCGCSSKPILVALESHPWVQHAWLNRSGTTAAVQWSHPVAKEETLRVVADAFANEGTAIPVPANEYDSLLRQFTKDASWYRATTIDALSEEEAELIAARLVRRIMKKVGLPPERRTALQCALACACREVLVDDEAESFEWRREAICVAIIDAARASLEPAIMAEVENTLRSIDYRPLKDED